MKDEAILPLLHRSRSVTFFTRDLGFYEKNFCHPNYSIVTLTVGQYEVASFIRRFLKHPALRTQSKRKGKVVRVTHTGMRIWQLHAEKEEELAWFISHQQLSYYNYKMSAPIRSLRNRTEEIEYPPT